MKGIIGYDTYWVPVCSDVRIIKQFENCAKVMYNVIVVAGAFKLMLMRTEFTVIELSFTLMLLVLVLISVEMVRISRKLVLMRALAVEKIVLIPREFVMI